jgi:aminoglycoside phosphotransferase (APT) family kinase protein
MHDVESMPARLATFLTERDGARSATVVRYETMVGGYSRLMAKAEVEWSDGCRETLVLRGDPPAGKAMIETSRDTEHALLRALTGGGVAIPALRHYDGTGDHHGTKCIVIDFVEGSSLQTLLNAADDEARRRHADDLVDTLASIHAIDPATVAPTLPAPPDWNDYLGALIDRFRTADADHVESVPFLRYVASWLDANRPPPLPLRVVHSDFQPANVMVTPDGRHLMIDWELAHIGDPREDLGYYNVYSAALGPNLFAADPERFLARYRERTGFSEEAVNMATMGYFSSLAAITVYAQVLAGAGAMAAGRNCGLMTTYTINALTIGHGNFLKGCAPPPTVGAAAPAMEAV